jgi:hypothetical protein
MAEVRTSKLYNIASKSNGLSPRKMKWKLGSEIEKEIRVLEQERRDVRTKEVNKEGTGGK